MENISTNNSCSSYKSLSNAKQRRSVSLLNLDSTRKSLNESLFDVLMKDPDKRSLILKMLSQENDNIKKYKDKLEKKELAKHRQIKKTQRLLFCESPTALQRRRALTRVDVDSDSSSSISSTVTKASSESGVPFESLLEGVFVYVDIRSEGKDRSAGAKAIMQTMGATVLNSLTKNVTHVLFKDGSFNTYQRAKLMKVHLVSVLWLEAIRKNRVRVPEKHYPALGTESYDANITQICQEYEEAVREEFNRSQAIPSMKHRRRTALPSDLRSQTAFFDLNNISSSFAEERSGRLSEKLVPSSQAWEAESIISHASSKFGFNKEQEKEDMFLNSPQLTSDDSDCGVVNGESMTQERNMLYNLDLTIDNLNCDKPNPLNSVGTSNCSADLRSSRVSVDVESTSSHRSATLLSRTLMRQNISGTIGSINNPERKSEEDTNLKITTETNRRTTLGVINHPSNEENLAPCEKLPNTSDMEITLNISKKRSRKNSNQKIKKRSKSSRSVSNSKENEIESNETDESSKYNESTNSLRASISKPNNTSKISKENSRSSNIIDTSTCEVFTRKTRSISFKKDSLSSKTVDTSNDAVGKNIRESLMASLEPSCEEMPSLRISTSSNEKNSRLSDIPSLRISMSSNEKNSRLSDMPSLRISMSSNEKNSRISDIPSLRISMSSNEASLRVSEVPSISNEKDLESGNLTKSKEVPIENQIASNKEPEQVQPETNKSNNDGDVTQTNEGKQKTFRKLFNLNDPIDETEIESNAVPESSQIAKRTYSSIIPLTHLQPLLFTQSVLNVIKKKNNTNKSRIPKKKTSKKPTPSSVLKLPKQNNTNSTDKGNEKNGKVVNKEVTLRRVVRRSQRLEKHTESDSDSSKDEIPITPQLSRRSTLEFMEERTPMRTQNLFSQRNKKVITSIVCTRMHKPEVHTFMQIVKKLKGFTIEDEVSAKTSHLVVGDCKRTINLLRAITRGCWIVSKEWLFRSLEAEKWLKEEDYELTSFSPAVQQCRKQRQAFDSLFSMDVFANCGSIYVSRNSVPRCSDLEDLIRLCNGTLTDSVRNASVVVGMWVRYEEVKCVNELWVLDCITFNKQKSFKRYLLDR